MNFSICIPTCNDLEYLKWCLYSLEINSYYSHEICVSYLFDEIEEYLEECKRFSKHNIKSIKVLSQYTPTSFNATISIVSNKYICVSHADFVFCPNWDLLIEPYITENDVIGIQTTEDYLINPLNFNFEEFNKEYIKYLENTYLESNIYFPFICRKEMWGSVGGMDENFRGSLVEDDLFYRIYKKYNSKFRKYNTAYIFHFSCTNTKPIQFLEEEKKKYCKIAEEMYYEKHGIKWGDMRVEHYNSDGIVRKYNIKKEL